MSNYSIETVDDRFHLYAVNSDSGGMCWPATAVVVVAAAAVVVLLILFVENEYRHFQNLAPMKAGHHL